MQKIIELFKKNAKISLILAIVILIIILAFSFKNFNGKKTVNMNETLNIKQSNLKYDFSVKVNSISDTTIKDTFSEEKQYKVVNITMTNRGEIPNPILVSYSLIDSSEKVLASSSSLSAPLSTDITEDKKFSEDNLKSNKSTTGNLYFDTTSNDAKKLRITVATKGLASTDSDIENYYINLK